MLKITQTDKWKGNASYCKIVSLQPPLNPVSEFKAPNLP